LRAWRGRKAASPISRGRGRQGTLAKLAEAVRKTDVPAALAPLDRRTPLLVIPTKPVSRPPLELPLLPYVLHFPRGRSDDADLLCATAPLHERKAASGWNNRSGVGHAVEA
jgi:hypothetical protein